MGGLGGGFLVVLFGGLYEEVDYGVVTGFGAHVEGGDAGAFCAVDVCAEGDKVADGGKVAWRSFMYLFFILHLFITNSNSHTCGIFRTINNI